MFGIGDFANLGRVSVRMLRHYDAIGLLRPARVEPSSGYRYYTAGQLSVLNRIVALKDLGFTLEQVQTMIDEKVESSELRGMLRLRRAQLSDQVAADTARLAAVREERATVAAAPTLVAASRLSALRAAATTRPAPRSWSRCASRCPIARA